MDFLPLFFKLQGKNCLVVGGGSVALRKASLLQRAGGKVFVVAEKLSADMRLFVQQHALGCREASFTESDLDHMHLVIAATDDEQLNARVSQLAQQRQLPVNVVDNPALCSFILPAIVDRSPVIVAVSSGGQSPVLARLLRARLESLIPAAYGRLALLMGRYRDAVKSRIKTGAQRRAFWEAVLQGPVSELMFAGKEAQAEALLKQSIEAKQNNQHPAGEVYLVGAGPGDPDLLTFRALRLMQQADVVLYDRLVSPAILDLCRRDAQLVHVGKARNDHTLPQEEINHLLLRLAKEGQRVCRLKGGDPFIFGRGGEEIELLAEHNIAFQVVPGITAASGCAAYAGIPLTHRDYSQSVRFVTGHLKDGAPELDWPSLIQPRQTLVFYMGLVGLEHICSQLVQHGLVAQTPIALVQKGTTAQQRVLIGTLETMPRLIQNNSVQAPTLIIVGEVVNLHAKLAWFETDQTI